ncbi:MAG: MoaD/ThiS family protein [Candidatus Lokiarchaeota archaeon]|nr:MoaD/ThiS family protein [Candidatus Lokiarchaeota archaeon]
MYNVIIIFFAGIREITQTKEIRVEFEQGDLTLQDIIIYLIEKYKKLREILFKGVPSSQVEAYLGKKIDFQITQVKFAINRKITTQSSQKVTISDGDVIAMFLPLIGG